MILSDYRGTIDVENHLGHLERSASVNVLFEYPAKSQMKLALMTNEGRELRRSDRISPSAYYQPRPAFYSPDRTQRLVPGMSYKG